MKRLLACLGFALAAALPAADVPYRPAAGQFPSIEKAHTYRGELVFVDHVNRRGSLRVLGVGVFRRNDPHPFAMLPYGMVRYHGAPADLRDIPLGTIMRVTAYLPPDPKLSSVPVLPVDNKDRDANHYRGIGVFPAENHVLLLEDEVICAVPPGHPWAHRPEPIPVKEFLRTAFVVRDPASNARWTVETALRDEGLAPPQVLVEAGTPSAARRESRERTAPVLLSR